MTDQEFISHVQEALTRWSVSELADTLHVSQPTIRRWAKGENLPYQIIRSDIFPLQVKRKIRLHVCCERSDQKIYAHWPFNEHMTEGWDDHTQIGRTWKKAEL